MLDAVYTIHNGGLFRSVGKDKVESCTGDGGNEYVRRQLFKLERHDDSFLLRLLFPGTGVQYDLDRRSKTTAKETVKVNRVPAR